MENYKGCVFQRLLEGLELVQWETGNQSLSWLFESVSPSHPSAVVLAGARVLLHLPNMNCSQLCGEQRGGVVMKSE